MEEVLIAIDTWISWLVRTDGSLSKTQGLQSFIGYLCRKNGELDITTHISAEAMYNDLSPRRAT